MALDETVPTPDGAPARLLAADAAGAVTRPVPRPRRILRPGSSRIPNQVSLTSRATPSIPHSSTTASSSQALCAHGARESSGRCSIRTLVSGHRQHLRRRVALGGQRSTSRQSGDTAVGAAKVRTPPRSRSEHVLYEGAGPRAARAFDASSTRTSMASRATSRTASTSYGQQGKPCPRCGTPIVREAFMNRGSHFCPRCQKRLRSAG